MLSIVGMADNYTKASKLMCKENEIYCWMNCLPAPSCNSNQQLSCYNDQQNECCSDFNDEPGCEDMDGTCQWHCVSSISTVNTPMTKVLLALPLLLKL